MTQPHDTSKRFGLSRKYQQLRYELLTGILVFLVVMLIGTLGYEIIEGWNWLDALYMTTITLGTVGYGETHPLDQNGRIFTIALIFMGLISIGFIVNRFTEAVIQGYFQEVIRLRQQKRLMEVLDRHYIICGFGRTGRQVTAEFASEDITFVVLDKDIEQVQQAEQLGYMAVLGDASLDETLQRVAIERAVCIVCTLPSDAENLYTVLSAKTLSPEIRAIARASSEEAMKKLRRGGADEVISPYITGGKRMAAAALRPQVMDFVDGIISGANRSYYIEEFLIDAAVCPEVGHTLNEARLRSSSGALVLAIRRADGTLLGGPNANTVLLDGDVLICMGTSDQLRQLNKILSPITTDRQAAPREPKAQPPKDTDDSLPDTFRR
jgi:voltage-gated potassium channel